MGRKTKNTTGIFGKTSDLYPEGFYPSKHSDMAVCFDTLQKKGRDSILPKAKTERLFLL